MSGLYTAICAAMAKLKPAEQERRFESAYGMAYGCRWAAVEVCAQSRPAQDQVVSMLAAHIEAEAKEAWCVNGDAGWHAQWAIDDPKGYAIWSLVKDQIREERPDIEEQRWEAVYQMKRATVIQLHRVTEVDDDSICCTGNCLQGRRCPALRIGTLTPAQHRALITSTDDLETTRHVIRTTSRATGYAPLPAKKEPNKAAAAAFAVAIAILSALAIVHFLASGVSAIKS